MKTLIKYLPLIYILFILHSCKEKPINDIKKKNIALIDSNTINHKTDNIKQLLDYDSTQWHEINYSDILLDLRYATTNNFVKKQMYECPRCFLRPQVAKELLNISKSLQKKGLRLKLFDCYRPKPIQQKLWNIKPDARYVTPPKKGSMHNRGLAIDLTIVDSRGKELNMGTEFDYFGVKAYHTTTNLPKYVLENRKLLKDIMERHGFRSIRTEWWHYSYTKSTYPLSDWVWSCN